MLFEKFGEFDSAEELNRAAAAQLEEGDIDAIYGIAEENGLDREDAEDYIDGAAPELCTPIMAALGKLKVEAAELEPQEIMEDWLTYIRIQCAEHPETAEAVRKKAALLRRASPQRQRDCVRYVCNRVERLAKPSASSPSFPVRNHCGHMQSIPTTGANTAGLAGFLAKLAVGCPHNGTDM